MKERNPESCHVLVEIETSVASGREILMGIARYAKEKGDWKIHHRAGHWQLHRASEGSSQLNSRLVTRDYDGIITRIHDAETNRLAKEAIDSGMPLVDVIGEFDRSTAPLVHSDDEIIGQKGFDCLFEQGAREFGFFAMTDRSWSKRRRLSFCEAAQKAKLPWSCLILESESEEASLEKLTEWLRCRRLPLGIMVSCDHHAPLLYEACRALDLRIPEEVAILGVNNDQVYCTICDPTLSSIDANHSEIGYKAAHLLDNWMRRGVVPDARHFVPPRGLSGGGSVGGAVKVDPYVIKMVQFVRQNATDRITVDDAVAVVPLSRREAQRRIRRQTGKTLHEMIVDERLRAAKELLKSECHFTIDAVSAMIGFGSRQHFTRLFRDHTGMSPSTYRQASSASTTIECT